MSKTVTIPCASCNSTGHRELPESYVPVLETLKRLRKATCLKLHEALVSSGHITKPSTNSLNWIYKQISKMESWGVVKASGKLKSSDGDLRKSAREFQVVG